MLLLAFIVAHNEFGERLRVLPRLFERLTLMLKCSTSLWSADLANLEAEIKRVEPFSERFHIELSTDTHVKNLLFFPDQVKALRKHTDLPFEVHLMTNDPWVGSNLLWRPAQMALFFAWTLQKTPRLCCARSNRWGICRRFFAPFRVHRPS